MYTTSTDTALISLECNLSMCVKQITETGLQNCCIHIIDFTTLEEDKSHYELRQQTTLSIHYSFALLLQAQKLSFS